MPRLPLLALVLCVTTGTALAQATTATDVLIADAKSQPESLTIAPGGVLIAGSASSPFIYKVPHGATAAQVFVDASADGPETHFLGILADATSSTLWACQLNPPSTAPPKRHSVLRGFELSTGAQKLRWELPGDTSTCNDFTVGPDKALYITDTANSKIYRLPAGATTAELFLENRVLNGVDGITFLDGTLYVNNVIFNKLYRIPIDANGKPGQPVDIWMDQPVKGPDGMRAAHGKLLLAENANGQVAVLTINGDKASVTVLKENLKTPTAVEPAGDLIWIAERGTGKALSIPMPK